jgi:DNA processing protein
VAAVPGPIDEARHAGSNEMLRDGAVVIAGVDDALALFGLAGSRASARARPPLDADASEVWDALAAGPRDADALVAATSLGAPRCLAAITALEMAGLVDCALTGAIARR